MPEKNTPELWNSGWSEKVSIENDTYNLLIKHMMTRTDRISDYRNQLVGTDRIFGRIIEAMKNNGSYDESLIIVTADTNVKGAGFDMRKVPLFIKYPNQSDSRVIRSKAATLDIINHLKRYLQSRTYNAGAL